MSISSNHTSWLAEYRERLAGQEFIQRKGWVRQIRGLTIESQGPAVSLGELCEIHADRRTRSSPLAQPRRVLAEVVGLNGDVVTLMPFAGMDGVSSGAEVIALGRQSSIGVGTPLLGRVIDGFGEPLDGLPKPSCLETRSLTGMAPNPMERPRIDKPLLTGVRVLDSLLTLGQGQRVGIFAGSGVGKSTLLGMIARHVVADVNVIALIGERGREVKEFIEKQLGPQGLARSVVVVATSDQPALGRIRAAYAAVAIAEYFRDQGQQVMLTMDSITRLAMARREVGLAAGEPPTARGYTPSVFAELPQLCERCGTSATGGAITALLTVLVEGDDMNEPVADALRSILDGHIVLSRSLAHEGHYPAIDVLRSASRLLPDLASPQDLELIIETQKILALLERNRQLVDIGAYESGSNPELDRALRVWHPLRDWLKQAQGGDDRHQGLEALRKLIRSGTGPSLATPQRAPQRAASSPMGKQS